MDLDISQYLSIFVEEAKEHLQSMNEVLLELEKDLSNSEYINEIFRVAHTIKGMSGTMGFHNMANLTHEMENLLDAARSHEIKLSQDVIDILFECFDELDNSVDNIIAEGTEGSNTNEELIEKLSMILNREKDVDSSKSTNEDGHMQLDSYVLDIVKKAEDENLKVYTIDFILSKSCMLKAARAFIIFNVLEEFGEVVFSNPSVEDIEDEKFEFEFSIILVTEKDKKFLSDEISQISEIEEFNISTFNIDDYSIKEETKFTAKEVVPEIDQKEEEDISKKTSQAHIAKIGKTVRVDINRLDNLMNLVSELIIIKTRMDDISESTDSENMVETIEYLERITTNLHDAVMKVRMVPIERVFNRFPRLVRDLSRELNKEIKLEMSGEETEVDRTVIDEIGDPLIHLIRNSIDHGIELPADRLEKGKPEVGTVVLKSYADGNNVVIQVEDDGRGIDHDAIKKIAIDKGVITEREAENLSVEDSINLLFAAGFSTTKVVSDTSGRGVGLDVVKSKIESINGNIEVDSTLGKGSKFIIRIPLTLAIIQALLIKLEEEIYAIPLSSIIEITNIKKDIIRDVQGQEIILFRGKTLPIIRLNEVFNVESDNDKEDLVVIIVKKGEKEAGLIVDDLIGQQEIVIKSLGKYLSSTKYLSGATILGNGSISLIIDVNSLI